LIPNTACKIKKPGGWRPGRVPGAFDRRRDAAAGQRAFGSQVNVVVYAGNIQSRTLWAAVFIRLISI